VKKKLFRRNRRSNCWNLTDDVIKIKDQIHNVTPDFASRFGLTKTYTCLRDMNGTNIYILEGNLEKLKSIELIYDINSNLINTTMLRENTILYKVYSNVYNKAVPPAVNIKFVWCCSMLDINIFMERTFVLEQNNELFKDLLNFQTLKDKYKLDRKEEV